MAIVLMLLQADGCCCHRHPLAVWEKWFLWSVLVCMVAVAVGLIATVVYWSVIDQDFRPWNVGRSAKK